MKEAGGRKEDTGGEMSRSRQEEYLNERFVSGSSGSSAWDVKSDFHSEMNRKWIHTN